MKESVKPRVLQVKDLTLNTTSEIEQNGFMIRVFHDKNDPETTNRVKVSNKLAEVEMLPSKGFSLGQAWIKGKPIFWDAPIGLPDTETIDLWSDEISINGNPAPGFTFLKTLTGGVELYGLKNWGMPTTVNGKLYSLHGETSNIPVNEVQLLVEDHVCTIQASFVYRTFEGDSALPWYERGTELFKVTRELTLIKDSLEIRIDDTIENISNTDQTPDWGYHITFNPEHGASYLVPSAHVHERGFKSLPNDIENWHKAEDELVRTETGIVHKALLTSGSETGPEVVTSLLVYPNNTGIAVSVPPAPYFQTWFCCGGKNSDEFTYKNGESLLKKNWDGMGIEIGCSPLDHNGNVDESVQYEHLLKPGKKRIIQIRFQWLEQMQLDSLVNKINTYNKSREFN